MKICKNCGREFTPLVKRRIYCSAKCRQAVATKRYQERGKAQSAKTICLQCGKEFVREKKNQKYCSGVCYETHRRILQKEKRYIDSYRKFHFETCRYCGKEFSAQKRQKYCSDECRDLANKKIHEAKTKAKIFTCFACGKEFVRRHAEKSCQECREKHTPTKSELIYGGSNLFAPCTACGEVDWLVIHHKDFNPKNNDSENIEYICKACHAIRHKVHKSLGKDGKFKYKNVWRSAYHFNQRYGHLGGMDKLREFLAKGRGGASAAAIHFGVSRELVRQWKNIYAEILEQTMVGVN